MNRSKQAFWTRVKADCIRRERESLRTTRLFWVLVFCALCLALTLAIDGNQYPGYPDGGGGIEPVPSHEPTGATP